MNDLISKQAAIDMVDEMPIMKDNNGMEFIEKSLIKTRIGLLPSAQQTLCGYKIEHLILIANVLKKENLPPERVIEALTDIGRLVAIIQDEFEETLRRAVEQCVI